MVNSAKLCVFKDKDALGYMETDGCLFEMKINGQMKMTKYDIRTTLMHEALHGTVTRRRNGHGCNPELNTDLEHLAMALLGDPDEYNDFFNYAKFLRESDEKSRSRVCTTGFVGHVQWWDKRKNDY